jgi:hypothetical protein
MDRVKFNTKPLIYFCKYIQVQIWACALGLYNMRQSRYLAAALTLRESEMVENHCFK